MAAAQDAVMKENQRQIDLLKVKYNNDVQKAIADNDYKKAAALLDDYNTQNNWLEKMAAQMANFGDFSGYGLTDEALNHKIIYEAGLWLDPGTVFGETAGSGFQRLVYATPVQNLLQALEHLSTAFEA